MLCLSRIIRATRTPYPKRHGPWITADIHDFRAASLRRSVTGPHSPTPVQTVLDEVNRSGPGNAKSIATESAYPGGCRAALHRNSHLPNTRHYQLTIASCIVQQQKSAVLAPVDVRPGTSEVRSHLAVAGLGAARPAGGGLYSRVEPMQYVTVTLMACRAGCGQERELGSRAGIPDLGAG